MFIHKKSSNLFRKPVLFPKTTLKVRVNEEIKTVETINEEKKSSSKKKNQIKEEKIENQEK